MTGGSEGRRPCLYRSRWDPKRLGDYELSGRLGEGGQGVVYLGTLGEESFAVKLLHGPVGDEQAAFLREVELAKHVARFCTAQVVDAGFDDGRPYIVSEYVDGPSLSREVALAGPRSGGALERLAVGTATALAAIHRAGIVHRDFKPQNVLLGPDGPRVIDFGLAKALDAAATVSGRGVGTPAYMAPEQITASAITGAVDVFSWGATMCFAANASAPFGQDSVAPVLHRILTAEPELGRLDGRLGALVEHCLDKDPRNRPTSRELLLALLGR
ncbi:serine/threonine-protein kinase [Nonomuraea dietziae]|uniref:serine/threonine-protein kinase n=1 Tax=Nonomuraea dietziae TaxID=65515 RepID=UPI0036064708